MARKSKTPADQPDLFGLNIMLKTAPCVPKVHQAVEEWRANQAYAGVTETTRKLLNWWFFNDHLHPVTHRPFAYHRSQQEAIETLVYIYEVAKVRTRKALLEEFALRADLRLPTYDDFARYCVKMATGSGKTKVMALAIAWQYFNAVLENEEDYAKTFLILAPNIIVRERLQTDFAGGRIFQVDPIIPPHLRYVWDMDYAMFGEGERAYAEGLLFLTNIQQFYERPDRKEDEEPPEMTAVLGSKPPAQLTEGAAFSKRIAAREGKLLVLNDEAHHTHVEESEWNGAIRDLHTTTPLAAQLDFSATPRDSKGNLFPWIISDYPLKQAILDNIVKRPVKGVASINEVLSSSASIRYEGFLVAGVERWKEYREQLAPLNKKPVLFVMLNSTQEAEDVANMLRTKYPSELGGDKTLVIHTDTKGEITKTDLDAARQISREVDDPASPVNAIVSVLMLREGWDVQNVTVVVGLRPFNAKANILPEQAIGRGLRLMFRNQGIMGYTERVDIIGNRGFLSFIDELERVEDVKLETFDIGKDKLKLIIIQPDPEKTQFDIGIPDLTPMLQRRQQIADLITSLNVGAFPFSSLPKKPGDSAEKTFRYEGKDLLTLVTLVEREYILPQPRTPEEVIGYYARQIADDLKLTGQFSVLAPKIREFFERKAFGETVDLTEPTIISVMNRHVVLHVVRELFGKMLRPKIIEQVDPKLVNKARMLSSLEPFAFSKEVYEARKCVLNLIPCDSSLERAFAKFLDQADDVVAFCKVPDSFGFSISYTDSITNLRNYFPDFVVKLANGESWIVETKGQETLDVARKEQAAHLWCQNATELTGESWKYLKVPQKQYYKMQPADFDDLIRGLGADMGPAGELFNE